MRGFEPPLSRPPDVRFTGLSYIPNSDRKSTHFRITQNWAKTILQMTDNVYIED